MNATRSFLLFGILTSVGCSSAAVSSEDAETADLAVISDAHEGEPAGATLTTASLEKQIMASGKFVFNLKCSADGVYAFKVRGFVEPVRQTIYSSLTLSFDAGDEAFDFDRSIHMDLASSADEALHLEETFLNPDPTHLTVDMEEGELVARGRVKGVSGVWSCSVVGRPGLVTAMTPIPIHATPHQ